MYLSSDKVKVFPIANRANNTLSEENVTFMNKSMYHGNGFARSVEVDSIHVNCIFNILGYTFEVNIPLLSVDSWSDIYAGIKFTGTNMIAGQDDADGYKGLMLASGKDEFSSDYTYIKIATASMVPGEKWKMPGNVITVGNILKIDGKR